MVGGGWLDRWGVGRDLLSLDVSSSWEMWLELVGVFVYMEIWARRWWLGRVRELEFSGFGVLFRETCLCIICLLKAALSLLNNVGYTSKN